MSRRFIPPAVDVLRDGPRSDEACEMARVREEGFADGLRIGRHEGHGIGLRQGEERAGETHQAELDKLRGVYAKQYTIEIVLAALRDLLMEREQTRREVEEAARAAICGALRTLFPVLLAQAAGQEIAALIGDTLSERGIDEVTLRGDPETIVSVKNQGLAESDTLRFLSESRMKSGTAVATWSGGGLSFDPAALLEQVAGILCPNSQLEEVTPA